MFVISELKDQHFWRMKIHVDCINNDPDFRKPDKDDFLVIYQDYELSFSLSKLNLENSF